MERKPRYSGGIETRTESDVTNFETKRCYESSKVLKEHGCLVPVAGMRLFHGRAHEGGNFKVNPFFDNAGNATGNHNINRGLTALHVATYETAYKFAVARARQKGTSAEISEVEITDQEASFFDMNQTWGERASHGKEIKQAFAESLPGILQGIVLSADDYKTLDHNRLAELIRNSSKSPVVYDDRYIRPYTQTLRISEDGVRKVLGTINARAYVLGSRDSHGAMSDCISAMMRKGGDISIDIANNSNRVMSCPINREYIQQWMRDMHIVGVCCGINSVTLGETIHEAFQVFNLETINSKEQLEKAREARMRAFGGATRRIYSILNRPESLKRETPLRYIDMDRRVTAAELIESAKQVSPKYRRIYESSAGNWEGFTLEEHTETALRIFDTSYKSTLPRSVYDLGRLCLLVHDIGKPIARKNGQDQEPYNADYARMFLKDIGAPKELVEAVPDIITVGKSDSDRFMLAKTPEARDEAKQRLYQTSGKIVKKLFGIDEKSPDFKSCVSTLSALCRTISTCDGASYTTYTSTRKKSGLSHRNMNKRFNDTYNSASNNPEYIRPKQ